MSHPQRLTRVRTELRRLLVGSVFLALVGTACEYDPAQFAGNEALSECNGPATIGVGWYEPLDGPGGSSHIGTEGDDVVVMTNGPVSFDSLGGHDWICIKDTGMASGAAPITIYAGAGRDTVIAVAGGDSAVVVDLGEGPDDYWGFSGSSDDVVYGGPGNDFVYSRSGYVDCGEGHDVYSFSESVTHVNCEERWNPLPPWFW